MKKLFIALAAVTLFGVASLAAETYGECVADSAKTGADAAAKQANDWGIVEPVTKNGSIIGGYLGGAAAGIINCPSGSSDNN